VFLEMQAVEEKAVAGDNFGVARSADKRDWRPCPRQHPAEVGAHGAGAQYGNSRPRILHRYSLSKQLDSVNDLIDADNYMSDNTRDERQAGASRAQL
jgi:hypothetical protein